MSNSVKLHNQIEIVTQKLDTILEKDNLTIHDMADIQRYASTIESLMNAKHLQWEMEGCPAIPQSFEVVHSRRDLLNQHEGYIPERG